MMVGQFFFGIVQVKFLHITRNSAMQLVKLYHNVNTVNQCIYFIDINLQLIMSLNFRWKDCIHIFYLNSYIVC